MNMLGAILKQLLEKDGIQEPVRQAFREAKRGFGGRAARLSDLVRILKTIIASLPEVFICIDALDECLPDNRRALLESLEEILRASPALRVFLTGRPHVRDEIKRYFGKAIVIPVIPTARDIERYLKMRLARDPIPGAMDDNLRAEIMRVIPSTISQMCVGNLTNICLVGCLLTAEYRFILVSLNIDAVLEEVTIHQRKKILDQMVQGNGLRGAYSATLARIKAQKGSKSKLGMQALMWLSHSERSLNVSELCHALGVEIGTTDLNSRNIPAIETLLGCSLGLITVEASTYTVRLVHRTLQEYLSDNTDLFHNPHSMIAQACLTYLNFQCIRDLQSTHHLSELEAPQLKYASCHWATHAGREMTKSVSTLALKLLDGFEKHVSSGVLLSHNRDNWDLKLQQSDARRFTGLHGAAYVGIVEAAVALLEMKKWDLDATDIAGNTAILWAARNGHSAVLKVLLEQEGVTPNTADKQAQTPLFWAVTHRDENIVKILLGRQDVTPDTPDEGGQTPLLWAAKNGCGAIVKMLLGRQDVTPDIPDGKGRTPLFWAVLNRHGDIVKMLLGRQDITPDSPDEDGRTPLSWAVESGHRAIVNMLLEREDVALSTADKNGRTPVSWAVWEGNELILEMLLGREDVTPNAADNYGRTPLLYAAEYGYRAIVEMLLEREDVTPDTADEDGRTPLSWAAGNEYEDIVEILFFGTGGRHPRYRR